MVLWQNNDVWIVQWLSTKPNMFVMASAHLIVYFSHFSLQKKSRNFFGHFLLTNTKICRPVTVNLHHISRCKKSKNCFGYSFMVRHQEDMPPWPWTCISSMSVAKKVCPFKFKRQFYLSFEWNRCQSLQFKSCWLSHNIHIFVFMYLRVEFFPFVCFKIFII